jgi:hypothetical protein
MDKWIATFFWVFGRKDIGHAPIGVEPLHRRRELCGCLCRYGFVHKKSGGC